MKGKRKGKEKGKGREGKGRKVEEEKDGGATRRSKCSARPTDGPTDRSTEGRKELRRGC
jgi:hypothetical protein